MLEEMEVMLEEMEVMLEENMVMQEVKIFVGAYWVVRKRLETGHRMSSSGLCPCCLTRSPYLQEQTPSSCYGGTPASLWADQGGLSVVG